MSRLFLPFFAAFAANSFLHFGFGVRLLTGGPRPGPLPSLPVALSLFLSGFGVWVLFVYALGPLSLGFFEPFLIFPLAAAICMAVERWYRLFSRLPGDEDSSASSARTAYDGLAYIAAFMSLRLASGLFEALLLSLGSVSGYLFCAAILRAVRARADTEPVPRSLRGAPLVLVAAGLLSIISLYLGSITFNAWG
jgi:hypothetical protein